MHKHHIWIAAVVIAASISVGLAQQTADTVLYNGKILTVDSNFTIAQAVAVRGNRITAVGTNDEVLRLAGPNTLRIDLKGKTVTPGLIHTHIHLQSMGGYGSELGAVKSRQIPLRVRGMKTPDEVLQQIRDIIAAFKFKPGEWLYFSPNWTGSQADLIFNQMNAKELDKAAPNNPIVMRVGISANNINMLNSMALAEMWRKYGFFIERYGRYWADDNGKPTGILEAPASQIVWEDQEFGLFPKPEDAGPYFRKLLVENYSSLGITTLSGALNTANVQAYQWLDSRDEMPLRYAYGAMAGFQPGVDMKQFQLGSGTDNVFISSVTARATDGGGVRRCIDLTRDNEAVAAGVQVTALNSGDMNAVATEWWPRGQCNLDIEYSGSTRGARISGNRFLEWYREVAVEGLRSANSHAAGEASIYMMLNAWERIDQAEPGAVKGWAFDHCTMVPPDAIPRAAALELMFSCNMVNAISSDLERGARSTLGAFGAEILHTYGAPIGSMLEAGINVSSEGEWDSIETMITRLDHEGKVWGPDQRIDRQTALKVGTQNGANYVLKGDQLGSLEPGKFADLIILDRDYMSMPEEEISEMRPLMTMKGGKFIFLRTDFSDEYNLKPIGAEISTFEELRARRPGRE